MQPFNLEAAKAGKKVVTRCGENASYASDSLRADGYPLTFKVGIERLAIGYTIDGMFALDSPEHCLDLFMADEDTETIQSKYTLEEIALLDDFAGRALIGILSATYPNGTSQVNACDTAYSCAATMLETRKKYISCSK